MKKEHRIVTIVRESLGSSVVVGFYEFGERFGFEVLCEMPNKRVYKIGFAIPKNTRSKMVLAYMTQIKENLKNEFIRASKESTSDTAK